jgi:hypothetical protein
MSANRLTRLEQVANMIESAYRHLYSWWNGYFWCNVVVSRSCYVERSFSKIRKSVWIYDGEFIGWRGLANKPT